MDHSLTAARAVIVSGKGGVGKTTIAAGLAIAAARAGKRVLLAEMEGREAFAPLFGLPRLAYQPARIAEGIDGMTIEADEALVEYLRLFYRIPRISRALIRSRAVEFATHTAPGLKDILLIGKVKQAESEGRYDLMVIDGPPTGRLPRFLDAPRAIVELVGAGPIRRQADGVLTMIRDPRRMQVVLVTQPEEMPVTETREAVEHLREMQIAVGPLVVNGVLSPVRGLGRDAAATLADAARAQAIDLDEAQIAELAGIATVRAKRARAQGAALKELDTDLPRITVPFVAYGELLDHVAGSLGEHL